MIRLREARKAARMTQTEVANFLGINQNTYSYWETGKTKIDNLSLKKIADLFQVSTDFLLDYPHPEVELPEQLGKEIGRILAAKNDKAQQAVIDFLQLDDKNKDLVIALIDAMKKGTDQ